MLHLLHALQSGLCPLISVQPHREKAIHIKTSKGNIARGSLMRLEPWKKCSRGRFQATVLSQVYFYQQPRKKLVPHGTTVCISPQDIEPLDNYVLYFLHPPPDDMGSVLDITSFFSHSPHSCSSTIELDGASYHDVQLSWAYIMPLEHALILLEKQKEWYTDFGEWILGRIWVNDWGRVALPLAYHSHEEIKQEHHREALKNRKQKSKAVIAHGPQNLWLHFLGTDALYSDVWTHPHKLQYLINYTKKWHKKCLQDPQISNYSACTTQIGDIAWYNSTMPDPLGHRTHYTGNCVDIRLFRSDASRYESFWNRDDDRKGRKKAYSLYMNRQYIQLLQNEDMETILFSDPRIPFSLAPKHDDHIHFCIPQHLPLKSTP